MKERERETGERRRKREKRCEGETEREGRREKEGGGDGEGDERQRAAEGLYQAESAVFKGLLAPAAPQHERIHTHTSSSGSNLR